MTDNIARNTNARFPPPPNPSTDSPSTSARSTSSTFPPSSSYHPDDACDPDLPSMPAPSSSRNSSNSSPLLDQYLDELDPNHIFPIPNASQNELNTGESFKVIHLQHLGLLNDSNICSLISLMLCFHRIGLKNHMIDTFSLSLDFPSMIFNKVLSALPSQDSFSLQAFIESWNESRKAPRIHPGFSDVACLADGILGDLRLKQYATRPPVLTQYLATFQCNACGKDHVRVSTWIQQVQAVFPLLQLPAGRQPVSIARLYADYLKEPFETNCDNCRARILNVRLEVQPGMFTILDVNRFDVENLNAKRLNKLEVEAGQDLLGELVSVVSHRGDVNAGNFVSYHQVQNNWYLNNDSRPCSSSENPIDGPHILPTETVELMFFQNNI